MKNKKLLKNGSVIIIDNFIINDIKIRLMKLVDKTNTKYEIYKLECYLENLYALIGKKVYENSKNKTITNLKLDDIFLHINEIKNQIANINNNKCSKCNYKIKANEIFCPICGQKNINK